jgi:hypothetical protein
MSYTPAGKEEPKKDVIPELRRTTGPVTCAMSEDALNWALEYAFNLGESYPKVGPVQAGRMVIQSLAGRNMLRILRINTVGLTEHVESALPLKTTQSEYEG